MAICLYENCEKSFIPRVSFQKYCCKLCRDYAGTKRWIKSHGGRGNILSLKARDFTIGKRFSVLKFSAKKRGVRVRISRTEYEKIISQPCYWCGGSLPPTGSGVDRLENEQGYDMGNCVPCCTICNKAKNDSSVGDFLSWVARVYKKNF